MQLIKSNEEIVENVLTLEKAAVPSKHLVASEQYLKLVHKGRCYYPYLYNGAVHFAPSRFIGYKSNTLQKHSLASVKDGKETTPWITRILKTPLQPDKRLEKLLRQFCNNLDSTGEYRLHQVIHKFWILPEIELFIESMIVTEIENNPSISTTTKRALIDSRVGQGAFRDKLLKHWKSTCALTRCQMTCH